MLTSHELLLKYRHDQRFVFSDITVWYVDRGALGDRSYVHGRDIRTLDACYFEITHEDITKYIPYHRIRKIAHREETIWER